MQRWLYDDAGTTLFAEEPTETTPVVDTGANYPILVGAHRLHEEGITGYGVTVAVLDTGVYEQNFLIKNTNREIPFVGALRCHRR